MTRSTEPAGAASSVPPMFGRRTVLYAICGGTLGACLTLGGYLVDYHALYGALPSDVSLAVVRGLHDVTPVHYFADLFSVILATAGGLAGWLQDRVRFYSTRLEDLVEMKTRDLRRSEQRYALVVDGSNDGIWDWDLISGEVYFSRRWNATLGHEGSESDRRIDSWLDRVHREDVDFVRERIDAHLEGTTEHLDVEYRIRHADGSYRWMHSRGVATRDDGGRPTRLAGSMTDIHERRRDEEQLRHLALHDPLTDLPNRTLLEDRLNGGLQRASAFGTRIAVLHVGVDRFKSINNTFGPSIGDSVLVGVGRRLSKTVSELRSWTSIQVRDHAPAGSVYRVEGDEFVIVLSDIPSERDAARLATRILDAHEHPVEIGDQGVLVNLSIGIAHGPGSYREPGSLMRDAKIAMNRAKSGGRARLEIFESEMVASIEESLHLETELYRALEQEQLRLWYQPISLIGSRGLVGFEALVRWEHPERGLIPPSRFIPAAEETGMIVRVSRRVFREAFGQVKRWQEQFPRRQNLTVSMNLSPRYLLDAGLLGDVEQFLAETGADPTRVHLEITETSFVDNPKTVTHAVEQLKSWGFRIALDDFGTGFSSLSMLHALPFDILKIDREFTSRMVDDPDAKQIVASILFMARKLELDVIAEGIETDEQLEILRSMRCKYGQGYALGRPMRADAAEALIRSAASRSRRSRARAS